MPGVVLVIVFSDGQWEGWRSRGDQAGWRLQRPRKGNMQIYISREYLFWKTSFGWLKKIIVMDSSVSRKQMWPAKPWWRSSVKHQSTSNQTQQPEPSWPCSAQCPKSAGRWRVRATPSPRASWGSVWPNMDETWARTPALVRMLTSSWCNLVTDHKNGITHQRPACFSSFQVGLL